MTAAIPKLTNFPGYHPGDIRPLMNPEGRGLLKVLVMGEALGEHEEHDRLPFRPYAEAGSVLERVLYRAGVTRDQLILSNLVWYRPPNNWLDGAPYELDAIMACRKFNDSIIEHTQPKCVLAMGGLPFRELTGMSGEKQGITMCRGFICENIWWPGIPVVGTYHPSFLRRGSKERSKETKGKVESAGGGTQGMGLLGVLIRDLQLALHVARFGAPKFEYLDYRLGATLDDWDQTIELARRNPDWLISYDLETSDSIKRDSEEDIEYVVREITQAQVSLGPGHAVVSVWTPDLLPRLKTILELPNPKIDWNGRKFDRPIIRDLGVRMDLGVWHDGMDLWHHSQPDLPKGLQFATSFVCPEAKPWKHQGAVAPLYYGALDVDMPQRIFKHLRGSLDGICEVHSGISLWEGYTDQVSKLAPVLDRMSIRGIPVDNDERLELDVQFIKTLEDLGQSSQSMVPESIRPIHPKEGYKRDPKICQTTQGKLFEGSEPEPTEVTRVVAPVSGDIYVKRRVATDKGHMMRWSKLLPFLPSSWQQVQKYIDFKREEDLQRLITKQGIRMKMSEALYKYDVGLRAWAANKTDWWQPRNPKNDKPSTAAAGLQRLIERTGDPLLKLVLEFREISTAHGTFVIGWEPAKDGRVHSFFGFGPATGQLSSENPNAQNFPQHSDLAHAMLRMLAARPGYKFVHLDWKSFHVLTAGFEAQDSLWMRMARIDMHSFFTLVGVLRLESVEKVVEMSDQELAAKLAWYRAADRIYPEFSRQSHPAGMTFAQIRDEISKRTILGVQFGLSAPGMHKRYVEAFPTEKTAQDVLDALDGVFDKPAKWRTAVRLEGDEHAALITRHGYVRRFWDVYARRPVADNYQPRGNETVMMDRWGRRWKLNPGDDHEAVVAYRPANDAFGIKRAVMVEIGEKGLDEKYGLINEIHDALDFECPDNLVDECIVTIKKIMEQPSKILVDPVVAPEGLWCAVDVKVGTDMDNLKKVKVS